MGSFIHLSNQVWFGVEMGDPSYIVVGFPIGVGHIVKNNPTLWDLLPEEGVNVT